LPLRTPKGLFRFRPGWGVAALRPHTPFSRTGWYLGSGHTQHRLVMGIDRPPSIAHLATTSLSSPWRCRSSLQTSAKPRPRGHKSAAERAKSAATARLLRCLTISAIPVHRRSQAKVFPPGPTFVLDTKQTSTLQFGNNHVDEILATTGKCGRCYVETIASRCFEPLLHGIGNVSGRTDPCGAGKTGTKVQLTNRQLLPSHPIDELSANAVVLSTAQRAIGHRIVQRIA
jgi:hypothetical protein